MRHRALALIVLLCPAGTAGIARGQARGATDSSARAPRWEASFDIRAGVPSGYVQVRENSVAGTRLDLRGGLDVRAIWAVEWELAYAPDDRTRLALAITSFGLSGQTTLAQDVYFNGTTLAAGSTLTTDTQFPDFLAVTLTGSRRIARLGSGTVSASAGLSFVALTFVLHGTLAAGSATRETQEDFVTQELPVPELGLEYRAPLAKRWQLDVRLTGGWLPWVNSLRQEGGVVTITQTAALLAAGVRYDLTAALGVTGTLRLSSFSQNEQSGEDGNVVSMRTATFGVGLAQRF